MGCDSNCELLSYQKNFEGCDKIQDVVDSSACARPGYDYVHIFFILYSVILS